MATTACKLESQLMPAHFIMNFTERIGVICSDGGCHGNQDCVDKMVDGSAIGMKLDAKRQRTKRVRHRKPTKDTVYKCAVCGDVAFGYNFSAITCESCKAFFRRNSELPANPYECPNTRTCRITKSTRKYCPACRFDKCLNVGMKREAVDRDGRPISASSCDETSSCSGADKRSEDGKAHKRGSDSHSSSPSPSGLRKDETSLPLKKRTLCEPDSSDRCSPVHSVPVNNVSQPSSIPMGNLDEFNQVHLTCQRYANAMMQQFGGSSDGPLSRASAPAGLGELLAKRFVRFVKSLPDFNGLDSSRQFSVMQANFISCHVVNYGFVLGTMGDAGSLPAELSKLHDTIRARFARANGIEWPVLLGALGLMTLFSPHRFVASTSQTQLLDVLYPLHYRYVRFLQQYLARAPVNTNGASSDWLFCLDAMEQVRTVGEQIARSSALGTQLTAVVADLLYSV